MLVKATMRFDDFTDRAIETLLKDATRVDNTKRIDFEVELDDKWKGVI